MGINARQIWLKVKEFPDYRKIDYKAILLGEDFLNRQHNKTISMISYIIYKFWLAKPDISIKLFVCNEIDFEINQFAISKFSNLCRYLSDVCEIL